MDAVRGRSVPYDELAERIVVGISVFNPFAVEAAAAFVSPADFYRPAHARLFAVAIELADEQVGLTAAERVALGWGNDVRVRAAARRAGVAVPDVEELVAEAPVLYGVEPYARRVAAAAEARRVMAAAAEAYNKLAEGADVEDVRPLLLALVG